MEKEIKALNVCSEEFLKVFHIVLEKFVNEYDDMAEMETIKAAKQLLNIIDQQ